MDNRNELLEQGLKITELAYVTGVSPQTIGAWYRFGEENPDHPIAHMLPPYWRIGNAGTRYWRPEAVEQLKAVQAAIPKGRNGFMGSVTQKYVKDNFRNKCKEPKELKAPKDPKVSKAFPAQQGKKSVVSEEQSAAIASLRPAAVKAERTRIARCFGAADSDGGMTIPTPYLQYMGISCGETMEILLTREGILLRPMRGQKTA